MKYLLCPDKFKGSLTAGAVCDALASGVNQVDPRSEVRAIPMADGGDGSLDLLRNSGEYETTVAETTDPLGRPISASFLTKGNSAFVELSSASGIVLLRPSEYDPMQTTTYGTGVLMRKAIQSGCTEINLFVGGSATNDAGMGIASALGFQFFDSNGSELDPVGASLALVDKIEFREGGVDPRGVRFNVICDVDNPFFGPSGAAHVYAQQKGADAAAMMSLDAGLKFFNHQLVQAGFADVSEVKGAGAAGGVGGGMMALFDAVLLPGVELFFDMFELDKAIRDADIIVTGEGKLDDQSFQGKVVGRVCEVCAQWGKTCVVVCGVDALSDQTGGHRGLGRVYAISDIAPDLNCAVNEASKFITEIGGQIARDANQ